MFTKSAFQPLATISAKMPAQPGGLFSRSGYQVASEIHTIKQAQIRRSFRRFHKPSEEAGLLRKAQRAQETPFTFSLFTICSYVLRMLCASLYLIMALSRRFSSMRIFRVRGESSRLGLKQIETNHPETMLGKQEFYGTHTTYVSGIARKNRTQTVTSMFTEGNWRRWTQPCE